MEYPFFVSDKEYEMAIYYLQRILKQYHIMDEIKHMKEICKQYGEKETTLILLYCLEQYNIEAKEVYTDIQNITYPSIVFTHSKVPYLYMLKKNKKEYVVDIYGQGVCKKTKREIEEIYAGSYIQIQHVGRLRREVSYQSYVNFLFTLVKEKKKVFYHIIKYDILYCFGWLFMISLLPYFLHVSIILLGVLLFLIWNIQCFLMFLQKKKFLQLLQYLNQVYGYEKIIQIELHTEYTITSKPIFLFLKNTYYQCQLYSYHLPIYSILSFYFWYQYHSMGIIISIFIGVCCWLYYQFRKIQKQKPQYFLGSKEWDFYLQNKSSLHQYQYLSIYQQEIIEQSKQEKKEYISYVEKKYRYEWLFQVLMVTIIGCFLGLIQWGLQTKWLSFEDSLHIALLMILQWWHMYRSITIYKQRKETYQLFDSYKQLPNNFLIEQEIKETITTIHFYRIGSQKIKYLDLWIQKSVVLKGELENIQTIFSLLLGKQKPMHGKIYINDQVVLSSMIMSLQRKIVLLDTIPFSILETMSLIENPLLKQKGIRILQTFGLEELLPIWEQSKLKRMPLMHQQICMMVRVIALEPDVILLQDALSAVDSILYHKILVYLQTCLPKTMVILYDSLQRKAPSSYPEIEIIEDIDIHKADEYLS